jgi:hypothetical protein
MMRRDRVGVVLVIAAIAVLSPGSQGWAEEPPSETSSAAPGPEVEAAAWVDRLTFTSEDGRFSLNIRGRIQPRFEYESTEQADLTRFRLRRARLDVRGHAYSPDLTYRLMPELGTTATLRDAWVDYRLVDAVRVRAGQYNVPFAWERDTSSNRQQFLERSPGNDEFQWPTGGRDIGLMVHGDLHERVGYGVGVFGGEGRNRVAPPTEGVLLSGRVSWAALGQYPHSEALLEPVEGVNFAVGAGAWYANQSRVAEWYPWGDTAPDDDPQAADIWATTADLHLQVARASVHLSGFFRNVDARPSAPSSYDGFGATAQVGFLIVSRRLFGALRYSRAEPDQDRDEFKRQEFMGGFQLYQYGHGAKVHVEAGRQMAHDGTDWHDTDLVRVQYQLLF